MRAATHADGDSVAVNEWGGLKGMPRDAQKDSTTTRGGAVGQFESVCWLFAVVCDVWTLSTLVCVA